MKKKIDYFFVALTIIMIVGVLYCYLNSKDFILLLAFTGYPLAMSIRHLVSKRTFVFVRIILSIIIILAVAFELGFL